jgi:lipopolysaccharide export system permease protein
MKKLVFQKFLKDTLKFFIIICFAIGLIVWVIQAVNFLDFMSEDGHGFYVYFSYTILNFPKIIHRILPFVFFISLFYQIIQYERRNELIIFWSIGISKLQFVHVILIYSVLFSFFQIFLGSYVSPASQNEARSYIRNSSIDFFPALMKEGKFIDAVEKLTIFIGSKDELGNFKNIFLEDASDKHRTKKSQNIYAKSGRLKNVGTSRVLELFDGKIIDRDNERVNDFSFKKIDFDLTKYNSKTTITPKIQEHQLNSLVKCLYHFYKNSIDEFKDPLLSCNSQNIDSITQEVLKRIYKPIYIPLLALLSSLMILFSKEDLNYNFYKIFIFLVIIVNIIISEMSLRYTSEAIGIYFFIIFPIIIFSLTYYTLIKKLNKNLTT